MDLLKFTEWVEIKKKFHLLIHRHPLIPNSDNYDFDDYNNGGEQLDDSIEYSNENTQSEGSDYDSDDEAYGEDESQISAYKRSRYVVCGQYLQN